MKNRDAAWRIFDQVRIDSHWTAAEFETLLHSLLVPLVERSRHAAVSERLMRYYMSEGLLSRPDREGLTPVFTWTHLAEIVALRVLMDRRATVKKLSQFLPTLSARERIALARSADTAALEDAYRSSDAVAPLKIAAEAGLPPVREANLEADPNARGEYLTGVSSWTEYDLVSGLRLQVKAGGTFPSTREELAELLAAVEAVVNGLAGARR